MSSAISESATYETSVIGPDGTDLISAAGVRTGLQDLANRTKFLKESFVVPYTKAPDMVGNDLGETVSFTTIGYSGTTADFALTLAIGDIVLLGATGGVSVAAQNYYLELRWYDGAAELSKVQFAKGAAWTLGEILPFSLTAAYVAVGAGAKTFSFQGKCENTALAPVGDGKFQAWCLHLKLGT